jgi:hypothetical protein
MLEYRGYKISSSSTPIFMWGCESLGNVIDGRLDHPRRTHRGKIFNAMKEAQAHGPELVESG